MILTAKTYAQTYKAFQWNIPEYINMGVDICDKWASKKSRLALVYQDPQGKKHKYTFHDLKKLSNKLCNGLQACGLKRGDRIGVFLPQCPETVLAHISAYKLGAIAIPLFTLFGTDALSYRLENSEAAAIITDFQNLPKILEIRDDLPNLQMVIIIDGTPPDNVLGFQELIEKGSENFTPVKTKAEDPALIIYTSGTTGNPKGTLHAHRTLLGHLPGVEFPHNFSPQKNDFFWTPADWAWIGGLIDVLLPSLYHGIPVLAHRGKKFDPEEAFHLIAKYNIKNTFMPPTALKLMRQVKDPKSRHSYQMRSIASGGETLGEELLDWGKETFGITINEFYGQTECNLVVGCCSQVMKIKPGSMGLAIPGRIVDIIDKNGNPVPAGTIGEIAVKQPNPVTFLGYWKNPTATKAKYINQWLLTGDRGKKDEEGYFWFNGRKDDIITSSGYRIGPNEIEECLMKHAAVAMVAVIGSPDSVRTEIVKAFIVLNSETVPSAELKDDIKAFVKNRLSAHEYPRIIEFIKEMPMTITGKIMRRQLKKLDQSSKEEI
ncbi:MAG: AMP-binding protein [Desulfobacteraceae bacterium]|nr:AMP-binding protein [Desulfobacteraceae bacterium]